MPTAYGGRCFWLDFLGRFNKIPRKYKIIFDLWWIIWRSLRIDQDSVQGTLRSSHGFRSISGLELRAPDGLIFYKGEILVFQNAKTSAFGVRKICRSCAWLFFEPSWRHQWTPQPHTGCLVSTRTIFWEEFWLFFLGCFSGAVGNGF